MEGEGLMSCSQPSEGAQDHLGEGDGGDFPSLPSVFTDERKDNSATW